MAHVMTEDKKQLIFCELFNETIFIWESQLFSSETAHLKLIAGACSFVKRSKIAKYKTK